MTTLKEWSSIICIASIVCTMIELICPSGKMDRIVKFVLASFMICSIIFPFTKTLPEISYNLKNKSHQSFDSSLKEKVSTQTLDMCSKNIKGVVQAELDKLNIKAKKIDVTMDTDKFGSISIIKVDIYLKEKSSSSPDVKKILEDKLGIKTEIIYGSD